MKPIPALFFLLLCLAVLTGLPGCIGVPLASTTIAFPTLQVSTSTRTPTRQPTPTCTRTPSATLPPLKPAVFATAQTPLPNLTLPAGAQVFYNMVYEEISGAVPNLTSLDIYAPAGAEGLPVMVFIHGGAWYTGDKLGVNYKPGFFLTAGYLFVSINYRLSPAVKHPLHVQDTAAALAWVVENIQAYGGDPGQIVVMGHSAGAHLAALVATDERRLQAYNLNLDILKGVITLDGAYDIPLMYRPYETLSMNGAFINAFTDDPVVWNDASPVSHVAAGKGIPPFLLVKISTSGDSDIQATTLANKLRQAGVRAEAYLAAGQNHSALSSDIGTPDDETSRVILEFLRSLKAP